MSARVLLSMVALIVCSAVAVAQQSMTFDWEDGLSTALGTNGNALLENSAEQAQSGVRSLKFWEDPLSGTPQAYIWWITDCADGDTIDASFYVYDVTPGANPSGRIWAHYTNNTDVMSYTGSAGGSSTYSDGTGWNELSFQWIFVNSGDDEGFVVEARIYSGEGANVLYIDNGYVRTSSNTAVIHNAGGAVPVDLASFSASATPAEVQLTWSTASELNNLGFNILRGLGSGELTTVSTEMISGAGTASTPHTYSFVDRTVSQGMTYRYWLEQVDFEGTTAMHGPVTVLVPAGLPSGLALSVAPSPIEDAAQIQLDIPHSGRLSVSLYDLQGRQVSAVCERHVVAGSCMFDLSRNGLAAGSYVLRATTASGSVSHPIVVK
ncbi:T9SS type A sorting domain-containing protein [Candidatus Fermentibacteria bacterium]|nr:T9SS type A sorting domain-containing protein [Candidatus Fermentibacteria bacterium]